MVERCVAVDSETTGAAEQTLGDTLLAPEITLLRMASQTQLIGWWFFKIEDLSSVTVPKLKTL